jgi:transposase
VQDSTLVVVIEMGLSSWLVAGMIPGVSREPLKKIDPKAEELLQLLYRWRDEAIAAGKEITRIAVAYETGRDSFWLARWLRKRGIDAHVIHATSVAISREHRRAKTDRIDTAMLRRGFLGWLRGEPGHCSMAIVPTVAEEDAKRPHRERDSLVHERTSTINRMKSILIQFGVRNFNPVLRKAREKLDAVRTPEGIPLPPNTVAALRRHIERFCVINEQIKAIEQTRLQHLERDPADRFNAMVFLLVRIIGLGVETAEQLVREILSRQLRDRKAVARYSGLTGSPDESGSKRRPPFDSRANAATARSISPASRTSMVLNSTPNDDDALWIAANWPIPAAMAGSRRTATRFTPGTISLSSSSNFPLMLYSEAVNPVALPPGCAKLTTKPAPTGSVTFANTIGTVRVVCCNAATLWLPEARMMSGTSATNSAAYLR